MNDSHEDQVGDVFSQIVEQHACMFCAPPADNEIPAQVEECVRASVRFSGYREGELTLLAPKAVALELAGNVLGLDPEVDEVDEDALDALGELMNVTVGQLLTTAFSDQEVFDLATPEVMEFVPAAEWGAFAANAATIPLVLEDEPVLLKLEIGVDGH